MEYLAHLKKDRKLQKLIAKQGVMQLKKRRHVHVHLCSSIMSQQLSTKVADLIHKRFLKLYNGKNPTAAQILATEYDVLRSIGLSNAKTSYVLNVARFAIEHGLNYAKLNSMDDESVIEFLTQIKGVGRWTAEMMLMFTLGREDVFALDDLGIQQAMIKLYRLNAENKKALKADMLQIAEKWRPYRTYACLYLWRWKDNSPKV